MDLERNKDKNEQQINSLDTESLDQEWPGWMFWKRRRYIVAMLAFFGFFNVYALRVNLSIAIVDMTKVKNFTLENGTIVEKPEFDWEQRGLYYVILSSFFFGYIVTQIPGGWLAEKIGGHIMFGMGIAVTAFFTLLTPVIATTDVYLFIAVRVIEGFFEGVTYPSIHAVWARWAPPLERSRLATIAFSGSYVGTVVSMPLSGVLADAFGWESIFYVFGAVGLIWWIIWVYFVKLSPEQDPYISAAEIKYIRRSLGPVKSDEKRIKHPWKSILTSLPVWAIVASHFSENWGFYTLLTQLPTFMTDMFKDEYDLSQTGFFSALPYLVMAIMVQFSGQIADWFLVKKILTVTQVRRYFNCGAFVAQCIFMLGAAFADSGMDSIICLTMAVGLGAFAWCGFSVNHLDIAPQHASVLMGLGNTFATIPGMISPIITKNIVKKPPTKEQWQIVFFIAAGVYAFGCVIYWFFASGELQPWAKITDQNNENDKNTSSRSQPKNDKNSYSNASYVEDHL